MLQKLRIGTRGSQLALKQTNMVAAALREAHPGLEVEVIEILTSGDWKPAHGETRLMEAKGGKGQFAHEIEQRILAGEVDCGVHSLKDMPSFLPDGLVIEHFLPREDPRDVFLSKDFKSLEDLPQGAVIGTSSLRRQAFVLAKRPDLKIVPLRGNVPTRIEKLHQGQVQGMFLALAGLKRLGLESFITQILEPEEFLPSCGQGIIGIEMKVANQEIAALLDKISCRRTAMLATAERATLQVLDGSCHTPVGVFAAQDHDKMVITAAVAQPDGSQTFEDRIEGPVTNVAEAEALGAALGQAIKPRLPEGLL